MATLKLTRIGNSVGVILPKEMLARLKLDKGDALHVTDTPGFGATAKGGARPRFAPGCGAF
jgi:putative addiction module antidote